jgi:hypothetical protein
MCSRPCRIKGINIMFTPLADGLYTSRGGRGVNMTLIPREAGVNMTLTP